MLSVKQLGEAFWDEERIKLFKILFPVLSSSTIKGAVSGIELFGLAELGVDFTLLNSAAVDFAATHTADVVAQITETNVRAFVDAFGPWLESGEPLSALTESLLSSYGSVRAEMIAVTETTRAFAQGNILAWTQTEVVEGKKWMTAQDGFVDDTICKPLAGTEVPLDSAWDTPVGSLESPPAHVRCRCYLQPVRKIDD